MKRYSFLHIFDQNSYRSFKFVVLYGVYIMRLSSLSRKLKLKPSELELFYENKGIKLLASTNSKLSVEQIKTALDYYDFQEEVEDVVVAAPKPLPQTNEHIPLNVQDLEIESDTKDAINFDIEEIKIEDVEIIDEKEKVETQDIDDLIEDIDDDIEVIKAPVIKLKGLTVKGKIELTPEKAKEKSPDTAKKESPISHKSNSKNITSTSFNPLEEARKKKAREERQLRKKRADQLKKEKRARYLKANPPRIELINKKLNKKPKRDSELHVSLSAKTHKSNKSIVTSHKNPNLFQRIWQWLNTY